MAIVAALAALLVLNVLANMERAGIRPGFGFLSQTAGFDVSEALIAYAPEDSYARVILAGVLNTLFLSVVSLILATLVGLLIGLMSVGPSPVGRRLALWYVELFRNLPKLLILLVLFVAAVNGLPHVRQAISLGPVHLSNRSIYFPLPVWNGRQWMLIAAVLLGLALSVLQHRTLTRMREANGNAPAFWPFALALVVGLPVGVAVLFQVPLVWSTPQLAGFDYQGGGRVSLQFMVIAATLGLYHGAQIGEVVRGGIESVSRGQIESALALGLSPRQVMRFVVLPQAIRIVIPSMNNQYANLIKNTSIAIAVGYSDLMSVAGTIINQTFRPLEMMALTMAIYLAICLLVTTALNRINDRLRRTEGR
ncbi:amino acid ABC transporter permease [Phyllobacterium phragmitis]|uniref:amino acid ABC transporter permease n=1 Tax=Phyllobacterium phragmitis TaxID=2670329 RepID=UPI00130495FC|nr:ABC transporter permease subunit [Phyllobacterium phragmitis]